MIKCSARKCEGLSSGPQNPGKMLDVAVHAWAPSTGKAEPGDSLEPTGKLVLLNH